ncbi:hypothetical protein [Azospirillum rugosum]|uniref:Histidine-specific methyltransferase SAM-dependent domain-containing protein n=2 Tax=Azospirillum rugosum TaxID=416170 RepID=A0ABS4SRR9_9PROT|nr:hypothetical protein [Azospirillum rugosum]MBP2295260.1 hypothetical protein [Azospirillum rugosum]MDQ0528634.1 hypothetical protein [Azospirillum rugosum]
MSYASSVIEAILKNSPIAASPDDLNHKENNSGYYSTFEGEGARKVQFVIEDLLSLIEAESFNHERAVALSIGGADGSDVLSLIERLKLKGGVLLEYDTDAALKAHAKASGENLPLEVEIGDATQKLGAALARAKSFGDVDTLIVLCFGVLHELPERSPGYSHDALFDTLFASFPNVLVYCAEPCAQPSPPLGWPEVVEIALDDVQADRLVGVAGFIRDRLFGMVAAPPQVRGPSFVRMHRDLAVELLHKVVRFVGVARFHYEMQERLTSFEVQSLARRIASRNEGIEQEVTYRTSGGFRKAYGEFGVITRNEDGAFLPVPFTHCRLVLRRFARNEKPAQDKAPNRPGNLPDAPAQPPGDHTSISVTNHGVTVNSTVNTR